MSELLIKLFQRLHVGIGNPSDNKTRGHILNAEVAAYGYSLAPALIQAISNLDEGDFIKFRENTLADLSSISGSTVSHHTLFKDFPYSIPDQLDYMHSRSLQQVENILFNHDTRNYQMLSCGHVINPSIFPDAEDNFGACPVCQFQTAELKDDAVAEYDFRSLTPLKVLNLADSNFINEKTSSLIGRNSSLSSDERQFVLEALKTYDIAIPSEVYRENLPLAYIAAKGDLDKIRPLFTGATDIIRLATFLSDNTADLSLSANTKFAVKRSDAKKLLAVLDSMTNLTEDMLRHREKWKRLLHVLHAGTENNKKRFPNVAKAAEVVWNNGKGFETFNGKSERLLREKLITGKDGLAQHLSARPGEFIRKLDYMLLHTGPEGNSEVIQLLKKVAKSAENTTLFTLSKYLRTRTEKKESRVFVPKGVSTKVKIIPENRMPLSQEAVDMAIEVLQNEIIERYSSLPKLGKVFIDPIMFKQLVPFNRRADSSTTSPVTKGSRFPLGDAPVIRLFTWWKGDFDVDLSAAFYDADFNLIDNIYYGHYESHMLKSVRYSGDIQNAPNGAAEFIDFNPNDLREHNVRYVLSHIISYRGEGFNTFPSFAGFMERDSLTSGRKFEPQSVKNKFDLESSASELSAHIFDLEDNEVIFADLSGGSRTFNNISRSSTSLQVRVEAVLNLVNTKTTLGDVLKLHALARGELVDTPEEADVVFDLESLKDIDVMSDEQMKQFAIDT